MQTIIQRLNQGWTEYAGEGGATIPIHHPPSAFDKRVLRLIQQLLEEREAAVRACSTLDHQLNLLSQAHDKLKEQYEQRVSTGPIPQANDGSSGSGRGTSDSDGTQSSSEKPAS